MQSGIAEAPDVRVTEGFTVSSCRAGHLDHHAHLSAQLQLAGELHPGANGLLQGPLPLSVDASPAALGGLAAGEPFLLRQLLSAVVLQPLQV